MADINKLATKIFRWEGGFADDPADYGGATNLGVTLGTWRKVGYDKDGDGDIDVEDIRLIEWADALRILKSFYWERWQADKIESQPVADILVDWVWCSGKWGIVIPQQILGVMTDGIVGPVTIEAVNQVVPSRFHHAVYSARVSFLKKIVENDPGQQRFLNGWLNRLNDFR